MLGVDERGDAAGLLGVGDRMQSHGRLAGGLGAVDLDDSAARRPPMPRATSRAIEPVG